jgi:nucleotide-binding universal stress UspA family protein
MYSLSTRCPVIVTHTDEREWAGLSTGEIHLRRVLAAYDFSPGSEAALSYALSLAQEYQAELHLIHTLPKEAPGLKAPPLLRMRSGRSSGLSTAPCANATALSIDSGL